MHGQYYAVVQINASQHSMVIATSGGVGFNPGDTLMFYGQDTIAKGSSTVASMHSVMQPDSTQGMLNSVLSDRKPFAYDDCDFMEVSLAVTQLVWRLQNLAPLTCILSCHPTVHSMHSVTWRHGSVG